MISLKRTLLFMLICSAMISHVIAQHHKLSDEELNRSTVLKIRWADSTTCSQIDEWVKSDIKNKTVFLFLVGGIAPVTYTTDRDFENRYDVYYFDFGDTPPDDKCIARYDQMVFEYLTTTYGRKWLNHVRKDVIGLSDWKKNKHKSARD